MKDHTGQTGKMLLHACCGPCSMEPSRIFRDDGIGFDIYFANSNIAPDEEYSRRLETLQAFADGEGMQVIEGKRDPEEWDEQVLAHWNARAKDEAARQDRCRACYRLRFRESARWAAENGYSALSTTLSVSPYQYTDIIRQELESACAEFGLDADFRDFRPYYDEATRRSREAGMYRQAYCGCAISIAEAEGEREERKLARKAAREAYLAEHADEIAAAEGELARKRAQRRAYDEKRARQRAILKQMREVNPE